MSCGVTKSFRCCRIKFTIYFVQFAVFWNSITLVSEQYILPQYLVQNYLSIWESGIILPRIWGIWYSITLISKVSGTVLLWYQVYLIQCNLLSGLAIPFYLGYLIQYYLCIWGIWYNITLVSGKSGIVSTLVSEVSGITLPWYLGHLVYQVYYYLGIWGVWHSITFVSGVFGIKLPWYLGYLVYYYLGVWGICYIITLASGVSGILLPWYLECLI